MMEQIFVMVPMRHLPQLQLLSSSWLLSGPKVINLSLKNCGIRHMQKIDYWSASICLTLQFFKVKFQCSDSLNCFFISLIWELYLYDLNIVHVFWSIFAYLFFFFSYQPSDWWWIFNRNRKMDKLEGKLIVLREAKESFLQCQMKVAM